MTEFSPREIVSELDRFIVGHQDAKRAVAVALRNRWRRKRTPEDIRDEITPKNILMIGPTGVGKTEIARRLARLAQAPFLKVEATKFTEVGSILRKGAPASFARRRDISVLPTPVGPIMRMFLGSTSSRMSPVNCWRRQRLRSAMATARFASLWPMM